MSLDRVRLKIELLEEMGLKADDRVEALTSELHRMEGMARAFALGREKIEKDVFARFKKDIDEGKVPQDPFEAVNRYLQTCIHYLKHLQDHTNAQVPVMGGRVQEATEHVGRLKKSQEEEQAKVTAAEAAQAAGTVRTNEEGELEVVPQEGRPAPRPVGVHPGPSLKAQRLAEEQALGAQEAAQEDGVGQDEAAAPEEPEPPPEAAQEPQEAPPVPPEEPLRMSSYRGKRRGKNTG